LGGETSEEKELSKKEGKVSIPTWKRKGLLLGRSCELGENCPAEASATAFRFKTSPVEKKRFRPGQKIA